MILINAFTSRNRNVSNESGGEPAGIRRAKNRSGNSQEVRCMIESNWDDVVDQFGAMNLKEELLTGIYVYGLEKPSAIQQRAIVPCINGRNVIFQARPGKQVLSNEFFLMSSIHIQVPVRQQRSPLPYCKLSTRSFVTVKLWSWRQLVSAPCISRRSSLPWVTS